MAFDQPVLVAERDLLEHRTTHVLREPRVTTRSKLGNAHANVVISPRSIDLETDVTAWLTQGQLSVARGVLATDADGVLLVRDLPVGEYAWASTDSDGAPLAGRVRVEAGRASELVVE